MTSTSNIGQEFKEKLALKYSAVGLYHDKSKPLDALELKKPGQGCVMPFIFQSAKGKTFAFSENTMGFACSAFYFGYKDWIFPGIENFLSCGPFPGRECERFVKNPELTKKYLEGIRMENKTEGYTILKPLENFTQDEIPEVVIFFANADQLSALSFLAYYDAPEREDRVITRFASACAASVMMPLQHALKNEDKAVWGMHDISARAKLPADLMTFALPFNFLRKIHESLNESFLSTHQWEVIRQRIMKGDEEK
ncbi:MAG: DUF169 domain-containing protein [Ignavibacteria bacterium]|jgi:uncharacterized protein (DUF169 family)|nr:DUF169 domain-containing protein [Ignavibacteria bacterium]MCU7502948.1 DUF169 domain-containing protein [Ignavibacteria bacterium]MCU7517069.1 DUF169 domain-containing protein [Ignavibacteria bacterium]